MGRRWAMLIAAVLTAAGSAQAEEAPQKAPRAAAPVAAPVAAPPRGRVPPPPAPLVARPPGSPPPPVTVAPLPGAPAVVPPPLAMAGPPTGVVMPLTDWRALDAENTLVLDTEKGRVVIELRPEFAPLAVARIKRLARQKFYDGLLFHKVIEGFMAQTGNPDNRDGSRSQEPDLPPEFTFRLGAEVPRSIAARPQGESHGFIGASPYVSVEEMRMMMSPDRRVAAWGAYCSGVVGMGRQADPYSGNSEFFILRQTTRNLDRDFTVVGRVVMGLDVVRALAAGDPPVSPDRMLRARVLADLPQAVRPNIMVLNTLSPQFTAIVDRVRVARGADFSVCDVDLPVRYN